MPGMSLPHRSRSDRPLRSATGPLLPARAQPLVAALVAAGLLAMAVRFVASGGLRGGLVDHDRPPEVPLAFTVDVNSAGEAELAQLPGVGPALARRIVDRRDTEGPFRADTDLLDVPGVGPVTFERLRPHLRPFPEPSPAGPSKSPSGDPAP